MKKNSAYYDIGSPVVEFLESSLVQVEEGLSLRGFELCPADKAELIYKLHATQERDGNGKIILKIVEFGGGEKSGRGHEIQVHARKIGSALEEIRKEGKIAEARTEGEERAKMFSSRRLF